MQDGPRWSLYLLSEPWYTLMDPSVRECMRLEMRLLRAVRLSVVTRHCAVRATALARCQVLGLGDRVNANRAAARSWETDGVSEAVVRIERLTEGGRRICGRACRTCPSGEAR